MNISVVIPVYNAEKYIDQCIQSVLAQQVNKEILVVEDGSKDDSLKKILKWEKQHSKIHLLRHAEGKNLGRSASRNLGIRKAEHEWIAFLDADDTYRKNRFLHLEKNYNDEAVDGFYDDIVSQFDSQAYRKVFSDETTGVKGAVDASNLLSHLIKNDDSHISLNGLVVRKKACQKIGGFDTELKMGEDTDFIWRLAYNCHLIPGNSPAPVAIRRVHGQNSFFNESDVRTSREIFYKKWYELSQHWSLEATCVETLRRKKVFYETGGETAFRRLKKQVLMLSRRFINSG